jgi:hypothetical protein
MLNHLPTLTARPTVRHLDLVFALDTICSVEMFEVRRQFIRNVLDIVQHGLQSQGQINTSVFAYGPHVDDWRSPSPQDGLRGFKGTPLWPDPGLALQHLEEQECQLGYTFEAAYEEVLQALYTLNWKRSSHRVLITVGHRPPHPFRRWLVETGDPLDCFNQPFCENNLDWRFLLTCMRSFLRMHSITVVCPPFWPPHSRLSYTEKYANACWKEIGYTSALRLESTSAERVADMVLQLV